MKIRLSPVLCTLMIVVVPGLMVSFIGCGPHNSPKNTELTYWNRETSGTIETNDAQRLQREVPFQFIFPTYVPAELTSNKPALIKTTGVVSPTDVEVRILYRTNNAPHTVDIREANSGLIQTTDSDSKHMYFYMNGVKALEEEIPDTVPWNGQQLAMTRLYYSWNQEALSVLVIITGYESNEGAQIVESMIK